MALVMMIRQQHYDTVTVRVENGKIIGKIKREDTHDVKEMMKRNVN